MKQVTITMPPLHAGQRSVRDINARFTVLACGRRWGKTRYGVTKCVEIAIGGGRVWWVAPTYGMAGVGWRLLKALLRNVPFATMREADRCITFPGGGEIWIKSADNPNNLRGEGLDYAILDECAFMQDAVFDEVIRPALSDRQGGALFISTPKGRNWFWRRYNHALSGTDEEWAAFTFPSANNPHLSEDEIEKARNTLPDRIFRQEYLAEFIDDAGGVFRNVRAMATAQPSEPIAGHGYVFGVDWGKYNDFTVIAVIDTSTKTVARLDRFNQIDYSLQVGRLQALYEKYVPEAIYAEKNSMGDPIIEQVLSRGMPVYPFQTTNASKSSAIEGLALAIERGELTLLDDAVLISELEAYEAERLPSGLLRYGAPQGMHDDTVMALAIGWHGVGFSNISFGFA